MVESRLVPDRNSFYMGLAFWVASKSKDPHTQCGSIIIDRDNRPRGWGYNGPPEQMSDDKIDWSRPAKYKYIVHAEANAIRHSYGDLSKSTIYVTGRPCSSCMLSIAANHISKVVYYFVKNDEASMLMDNEDWVKSMKIADLSDVELIKYSDSLVWMDGRIAEIKKLLF
jgi:deoxycytidylate deaminase